MKTSLPSELPVALVTGSSSGIGAALAERLAAEGYLALINAPSETEGARRTLETIRAAGHQAEYAIGDLSNVGEIKRVFGEIREKYGRIDVLVNNAGICPFHEWDEVTEDVWDRTHSTNLKAGYFCTQEAARLMIEKKIPGRIMVISSISAIKGGTVHGESDAHAAFPVSGIVSPADITATIFHCLGYSPETMLYDQTDRPIPLSRGHVIKEIVG